MIDKYLVAMVRFDLYYSRGYFISSYAVRQAIIKKPMDKEYKIYIIEMNP